MAETPETRYAKAPDDIHIAYQVSGGGPIDLVPMINGHTHLEMEWTWPLLARFLTRLESFSRLIRWDARGTGMSDSVDMSSWSIEDRARDLISVLDAIGSERVAVCANNVSGPTAIFFAATYPDRTSALVLDGCFARFTRADDYPVGVPQEVVERSLARVDDPAAVATGSLDAGLGLENLAPSFVDDPEFVTGLNRLRNAASRPSLSRRSARAFVSSDVRPLLGAIRAPTLVLCRSKDQFAGPRHAQYLAEHITGAKLVELPGNDNYSFVGDSEAVLGEVEEFLTGARHSPELDRILATVLFTDIVGSTDRAAEVGDRKWRELLDQHDATAREEIERLRGQFVKSTGDGVVATFDGPARGIRCAQAISRRTAALGIDVRSGLHTGEVEHRANDLHGLAVHVAQRVSALAGAGEVLVSRTVVDLVAGSDIQFEDHGEHELKGVPGTWRLSLVTA